MLADSWLYDTWSAREGGEFSLPPSRLALEPSDIVTANIGGRSRQLRITEIGENTGRDIRVLAINPKVFEVVDAADRAVGNPGAIVFGIPDVAFLDLPLLSGNEDPNAGYVAAYQTPWPGGVAFFRSPETTGYQLNIVADTPAIMGQTLDDLYSHPSGRWDFGTRLNISINSGELSSYPDVQIFDGRNLAAVKNPDGSYEVIQFRDAVLVGENTYELSALLRGQGGTEGAMGDPVAAGARFILLDAAVQQIDMTLDDIGRPFNWTFGPRNRDIGDPTYGTALHTYNGLGLRPLSPVHIGGERVGNDLTIRWIRRTRIGGDSWEQVDVPLGEDVEAYEIDVLDGTVVKRTLSSSTSEIIYSEVDQVADWGSVQASYEVAIYQLSAISGRGEAGRAWV